VLLAQWLNFNFGFLSFAEPKKRWQPRQQRSKSVRPWRFNLKLLLHGHESAKKMNALPRTLLPNTK
jgi:hypothetical protein